MLARAVTTMFGAIAFRELAGFWVVHLDFRRYPGYCWSLIYVIHPLNIDRATKDLDIMIYNLSLSGAEQS